MIIRLFAEFMNYIKDLCELLNKQELSYYEQVDYELTKKEIDRIAPQLSRFIEEKNMYKDRSETLDIIKKTVNIRLMEHDSKYYLVVDKVMHEITKEEYDKSYGWLGI